METTDADLPPPTPAAVTVYFDGACPLCRREIAHYQRVDSAAALCFVDVSASGAPTPAGVDRRLALARFHVLAGDGRVVSGAAGFLPQRPRLARWLQRYESWTRTRPVGAE
jgi:predicted DCC family thiol-disulfide oxidoreductase YuxK